MKNMNMSQMHDRIEELRKEFIKVGAEMDTPYETVCTIQSCIRSASRRKISKLDLSLIVKEMEETMQDLLQKKTAAEQAEAAQNETAATSEEQAPQANPTSVTFEYMNFRVVLHTDKPHQLYYKNGGNCMDDMLFDDAGELRRFMENMERWSPKTIDRVVTRVSAALEEMEEQVPPSVQADVAYADSLINRCEDVEARIQAIINDPEGAPKPKFAEGVRVVHPEYGAGEIKRGWNLNQCQVLFDNHYWEDLPDYRVPGTYIVYYWDLTLEGEEKTQMRVAVEVPITKHTEYRVAKKDENGWYVQWHYSKRYIEELGYSTADDVPYVRLKEKVPA